MITKFKAERYGCLRDIELELRPLHALIGPNDSGKSTILRGIRTLAQLAGGDFSSASEPFDPALPKTPTEPSAFLGAYSELALYTIEAGAGLTETLQHTGWEEAAIEKRAINDRTALLSRDGASEALASLGPPRLLRLDPDALRRPAPPLLGHQAVTYRDERGEGLASVLQAINSRDVDRFVEIRDAVRRLFPTVRQIRVPVVSPQAVTLQVELTNGTVVEAPQLSEGLLYYLAFTTIRDLSRAPVLLLEEPENGLHPARIREVMRLTREFVAETGTQVILATHSPLVINEMQPEEVTVVTRPSVEEGTVATPITATPHFERRTEVFELGELWLAYADGKLEAPLFDSGRR